MELTDRLALIDVSATVLDGAARSDLTPPMRVFEVGCGGG